MADIGALIYVGVFIIIFYVILKLVKKLIKAIIYIIITFLIINAALLFYINSDVQDLQKSSEKVMIYEGETTHVVSFTSSSVFGNDKTDVKGIEYELPLDYDTLRDDRLAIIVDSSLLDVNNDTIEAYNDAYDALGKSGMVSYVTHMKEGSITIHPNSIMYRILKSSPRFLIQFY